MALIDDYQKALNKIDREYDRLESSALSDLLSTTRQLTKTIAAIVADIDPQAQVSNRIAQVSVNRAIDEYQATITDRIRTLFGDISELGSDSVADPLAAIDEPTEKADSSETLALALGSAVIVGAGIAQTLRSAITANIRLGSLANLSPSRLMPRIRKSIASKFASIRTTVRTETTRAFNMAHDLQSKATNRLRKDKMLKGWLTVGDNRVRPTHRAAGRSRPIPVNQLFRVGADKLRFPGDPKGSPEETINCRCRMYTIPEKVLSEKPKQAT